MWATYSEMIMDVQPGTNNGGEYSGDMPVDARQRDDYEPEDLIPKESEDTDNWKTGLW